MRGYENCISVYLRIRHTDITLNDCQYNGTPSDPDKDVCLMTFWQQDGSMISIYESEIWSVYTIFAILFLSSIFFFIQNRFVNGSRAISLS